MILMAHGSDIWKSCKMVVDVVESNNSVVSETKAMWHLSNIDTYMKIACIVCILDLPKFDSGEIGRVLLSRPNFI